MFVFLQFCLRSDCLGWSAAIRKKVINIINQLITTVFVEQSLKKPLGLLIIGGDRSDTGESIDSSTVGIPLCRLFSFSGEYIRSYLLGFHPKGVRVLSSIN